MHFDNPNLFWDIGLIEESPSMPIEIALNLKNLNEQQLIEKATTIGTKMALPANAALVTGSPFTGAQVTTFTGTFSGKRQDGIDLKQTIKTNTSEKNTAKSVVEDALTRIKKFVESKPTVTIAEAMALGFEIKSEGGPPQIVAPEDLSITYGDAQGSVSGHWQPVAGAAGYIFQYRLANTPGAVWVTGYNNTASDCRVAGLTAGALYEFQVCAIFSGVENPGPACSVVEHRAA
jgi:hypothetical protein